MVQSKGFKSYPISPGGICSDVYPVTVNGTSLDVERIRKYSDCIVNYVRLDYDGTEILNFVVSSDTDIGNCYSISPKRAAVSSTVYGNQLIFSIAQPHHIIMKIETKEDLFILIDSLEKKPPRPEDKNVKNIMCYAGIDATGEHDSSSAINQAILDVSNSKQYDILYFPAGKYISRQINMQSNVTIYLEGGVLIQATDTPEDYPNGGLINWYNITDANLIGRGQLDGNGRVMRPGGNLHIIAMDLCRNCNINGITERDSAFWANHIQKSDRIHFEDFKVINYRPYKGMNNSDGLNFDCSKNCSLYNGFLYTGDDNCVVKGTLNDSRYNTDNIIFSKYIGYSNSATCKIGTETTVDSITKIY